jgi:hypothetical protein
MWSNFAPSSPNGRMIHGKVAIAGMPSSALNISCARAMETDVTYQAFDARTNRVLGEFPTLAAAQEAIGEQDDFFVMRCDEGESPELVWET